MAQDDGQERTEQPTPKKLRQAREQGQVARSRELNTMAVLVVASGGLLLLGPGALGGLVEVMRRGLQPPPGPMLRGEELLATAGDLVVTVLWALSPLLAALTLVALVAPVVMSGWNFTVQSLALKWERIDPIRGLARMVSRRALIELGKALAKFLLIAVTAIAWLHHEMGALLGLGSEALPQALADAAWLLEMTFLVLTLPVIAVAAVDVPLQLWEHARQLRMTRQEIKDEYKESEGRPEVRSRIRSIQQELARHRMMQEVPKADVIVTNPTHYAIALVYRPENMGAPRVVAKGADWLALQIRSLGQRHGVPVVEAAPLARALYFTVRVDREIPAGLYLAAAQVLAYVYQLRRGAARAKGSIVMDDLPIPEEYRNAGMGHP